MNDGSQPLSAEQQRWLHDEEQYQATIHRLDHVMNALFRRYRWLEADRAALVERVTVDTSWLKDLADRELGALVKGFEDNMRSQWGDPLPRQWADDWKQGWQTAIAFVRAQLAVDAALAPIAGTERQEEGR